MLVPPVVEQLNNLIQNLPPYAADLQDFVDEERAAAGARGGLQHHGGAAEAGERRCPARVGDAAGILSDIGLGLVNSIFAGGDDPRAEPVHDRVGPQLAATGSPRARARSARSG